MATEKPLRRVDSSSSSARTGSMARVVSLSAQALQGSAMLGGTQDLWLTTCEVAAQRLLLACPDSVWMQLSAWKSSGLGPELWDEEESEDVERERCWERELLFGVFVLAFMQQPSKALGHRAEVTVLGVLLCLRQ
ncbi:unnamed protein product [Durusdinium trenchii]|uniref:Uncharacterized protein n=1 Tax=Durusdinium trenchii TaxID=1381693 RepID=A0ABP0NGJ2_9DINO